MPKCEECKKLRILFGIAIYCGLHYTPKECEEKHGFESISDADAEAVQHG